MWARHRGVYSFSHNISSIHNWQVLYMFFELPTICSLYMENGCEIDWLYSIWFYMVFCKNFRIFSILVRLNLIVQRGEAELYINKFDFDGLFSQREHQTKSDENHSRVSNGKHRNIISEFPQMYSSSIISPIIKA